MAVKERWQLKDDRKRKMVDKEKCRIKKDVG